ncbi:MAG: encapsulin-associated ferritin-like protein [Acidithiobacillus sp.]
MAHEGLHEAPESLNPETMDEHRAIQSLMEEFEAVDWYRQRADACTDPELKAVLLHNMNEEIEHASMILEWLRRRMPRLDKELREYLFKEGSITGHEAEAMGHS